MTDSNKNKIKKAVEKIGELQDRTRNKLKKSTYELARLEYKKNVLVLRYIKERKQQSSPDEDSIDVTNDFINKLLSNKYDEMIDYAIEIMNAQLDEADN